MDVHGPLSEDVTWGAHMKFTSAAIADLGRINGPRCCKRDAMLAFRQVIAFVNEQYPVTLEQEEIKCEYSSCNAQ